MEGPASVLCLRTCYIKPCKPPRMPEGPSELPQSRLSRSCSCSRSTTRQRRSNSVSKCALPIIPEYPGFQDIKLSRNFSGNPAFNPLFQDLERGKKPSFQLSNFSRGPPAHRSGSSPSGCSDGHATPSPGFHDKPLQDYFKERLLELGGYGSKRSSRKTKGFADQNQDPALARRGWRRRSSCGAAALTGHGRDRQEPFMSTHQGSERTVSQQGETQKVLKLHERDFLDILTMHVAAPLEALVQKK